MWKSGNTKKTRLLQMLWNIIITFLTYFWDNLATNLSEIFFFASEILFHLERFEECHHPSFIHSFWPFLNLAKHHFKNTSSIRMMRCLTLFWIIKYTNMMIDDLRSQKNFDLAKLASKYPKNDKLIHMQIPIQSISIKFKIDGRNLFTFSLFFSFIFDVYFWGDSY